jgi:hypothetical protein
MQEERFRYIKETVINNIGFDIDNEDDNFNKIIYIISENVIKKEYTKPENVVNNIILKEIIKYINQNKSSFEIPVKSSNTSNDNSVSNLKNTYDCYHVYNRKTPFTAVSNCKNITISTLEYCRKYNITSDNNTFIFREVLQNDKLLLSEEKILVIEKGYYTLDEFIYTFNYIMNTLETVATYRLFYDKKCSRFVLESNNINNVNSLAILKAINKKDNVFAIIPEKTTMNTIFNFYINENNHCLYYSISEITWENVYDYFYLKINGNVIYIGEIKGEFPVTIDMNRLVNIENIEITSDNFYIKSALLKLNLLY